jgi:hypothetical protein
MSDRDRLERLIGIAGMLTVPGPGKEIVIVIVGTRPENPLTPQWA